MKSKSKVLLRLLNTVKWIPISYLSDWHHKKTYLSCYTTSKINTYPKRNHYTIKKPAAVHLKLDNETRKKWLHVSLKQWVIPVFQTT